ncbi:6286_t:CDS:2, partial [Ambispora leptoticha]
MSTLTTTSSPHLTQLRSLQTPYQVKNEAETETSQSISSTSNYKILPATKKAFIPDWFKRKFSRMNPTLYLENQASVARDHLANERTFLAWLRTSLAFISIGVAITQLFRLNVKPDEAKMGKPLGVIFIVLGIVFLSFGLIRYFRSQSVMTRGKFPASRGTIVIGTIITMLSLL